MVDNEMKKCNQCMFARICHEECVAICEDGGEKEIEKYIDKGYEKCDQQQGELEELGLVNYGDSSYYFSHPDEYDKDKRIAELPKQIVEKIREELFENKVLYYEVRKCDNPHYQGNYVWCNETRLNEFLDNLLKDYQGDGE